jgi:hypothetical protein
MEATLIIMKSFKYAIPALVLGVAFFFSATTSFGKPEYTKKEKKGCVTCHTAANSKELNDVGKCYGKSKALEGCVKK